MAIGWGGFATGLTAGSQAVARAYQAKIDAENQAYLQEERERDRVYKAGVAELGAPAELTEQRGLMVTGPEEGARSFYIPADATAGAEAYTRAGYKVAEAPTQYQEARVRGGKTLGQVGYDEVAGPWKAGAGPATGLQEDWNNARMQRLEEFALASDRPERAAAYSTLTGNKLAQTLTRAKIEDIPQEREARALANKLSGEQFTAAQRVNAEAEAAAKWRKAAVSEVATLKHYNEDCPDGGCARVVPDPKTGLRQLMVKGPDNVERPVGKPYKTWEDGGKQNVLSNIPALADVQVKAEIEHNYKLREIEATGAWHKDYARIMAAARGTGGPSKQELATFQKEHDEINKQFKAGEITYPDAVERINIAGAKIGRPLTPPKESKLDSMPYPDKQALRADAMAELSKDEKFKKIPKGAAGDAARKTLIEEKMEELMGGPGNVKGSRSRTKTGTTTGTGGWTYPPQWGGSGGAGASLGGGAAANRPAPGSPIVNPGPFEDRGVNWAASTPSASTVSTAPPNETPVERTMRLRRDYAQQAQEHLAKSRAARALWDEEEARVGGAAFGLMR